MADVYPGQALFESKEGRATLVCRARSDGVISGCAVEAEEPAGYGFGAAAISLSKRIKAGPCSGAESESIRIPLKFVPPPEPPSRDPVFDPQAKTYARGRLWPAGPYWPEYALETGLAGVAILDCKLQPNGRLWPCRPAAASRGGEAFADASLKMAERGWMRAAPLAPGEVAAPDLIYRFKIVFERRTLRDGG